MDDKWMSIKIARKVYLELLKLKGELSLKKGRHVSINETITFLINEYRKQRG